MTNIMRRFYIICFTFMLLLGINLSVYQSVVSDINDFFGVDGSFFGAFIAVYFVGSLFAPALAGELSDRIGKKIVLMISSAVFLAGIIIVSQAGSFIVCAVGILMLGSGSVTIEGLFSAKITDENPESSEKLMNFSQLFFCVGAVLGPMLTLFVKSYGANWQVIMLMIAAVFVPAAITLLWIPKDKVITTRENTEKTKGETASLKDSSKNKKEKAYSLTLMQDAKFLVFFFAMLLYVGVEIGVGFSVTRYFSQDGEVRQTIFTGEVALSLFWVGMIVGRFIAGLLNKFSDKIMIICLVSGTCFSFLLQFQHHEAVSVVLFFLIGLSLSAIWPLLMAFCTMAFKRYSGTAGGLMVVGGSIGGMLMPILMGIIANAAGIRISVVVSTCSMAVMLVLYLLSRRKRKSD